MSARRMIDVEGLSKSFRIPVGAPLTLKQRVLHPLHRAEWREFDALDDVSFHVDEGEFFGIVGRNGCGKSTLLKILSGIYRPDAGAVRVDGSVAPLIELGVGFNHELSARDNVFINATLLGLTRREVIERYDEIVAFAELDGFMDLKLRNFSSGMVVRLAFAIAVQADAEVLLVDEVLAVGDERFQKKCFSVFRERRRRGQTVVFVSHDMGAVQQFCNRAMLLVDGAIAAMDDPFLITRAYHRANSDQPELTRGAAGKARLERAWVEHADEPGSAVDVLEQGRRARVAARIAFDAAAPAPTLALTVRDRLGSFAVRGNTAWSDQQIGAVEAGEVVTVSFEFDNLLGAGRYSVRIGVADPDDIDPLGAWDDAVDFAVSAPVETLGIVDLPLEIRVERSPGDLGVTDA